MGEIGNSQYQGQQDSALNMMQTSGADASERKMEEFVPVSFLFIDVSSL